MEVDYNKKEKIVGMFVIGTVVIMLAMLIIIGRGKDWFKTYITYYTTFDESYNLREDAAVKLYKADIGKVKKITLTEDKVRVELVILENYSSRIKSDSVAIVDSPTFIGSEYISIIPGSADASLIEKGGEIPSREKKSVSDILAEFEVEKTAKMVIPAIQDVAELAQIMRDPKGPLFTSLDSFNRTLSYFERVARDIEAGKGTIGGIIRSRVLLDKILGDLDKLSEILENINKASSKTPVIMDQVQDNLAAVKNIGDDVSESVSSIKRIVKQVEENRDIPEITHSVKNGIKGIRDSVDKIDKVVQSLQENFLIKLNLPPEEEPENIDAGLRQ
ncbi:MAG: MCE family protein [Desulfobacteraceae bacterium]|nr:MCE family protein [Desulfobacteraceae bacterium]MBC2719437.1 MCE family protein [Desulfobacteraceae bacterium]